MMTDEQRLMEYFKGDKSAVRLALQIARLSHIWDDLIDRDPVSDDEINEAFWIALVDIPTNPFYQQFAGSLQPVIATSIINYVTANSYERSKERAKLELANVLRYSVADVILLMAILIGGREWGMRVAPELRMLCQKDTLSNYLKEHGYESN